MRVMNRAENLLTLKRGAAVFHVLFMQLVLLHPPSSNPTVSIQFIIRLFIPGTSLETFPLNILGSARAHSYRH